MPNQIKDKTTRPKAISKFTRITREDVEKYIARLQISLTNCQKKDRKNFQQQIKNLGKRIENIEKGARVFKEEIEEKFDDFEIRIYNNMRFEMAIMDDRIEKRIKVSEDRIMTALDDIVGQLSDMRTEMTMMHGSYLRIEEKVDNHEIRIIKLEQTPELN